MTKKNGKKIDELQLAKYKNIKAEIPCNSKIRNFIVVLWHCRAGTVFMGFFSGIAFLAMMASCLMFKILSGSSKHITRYQMLH